MPETRASRRSAAAAPAAPPALADAVEALSEGFATFDPDGRLALCNARFRELNPAIADLLLPGAAFDILLREAVGRGALDAATGQRIAWLEARVEPGAAETLEFEAPNARRVSITLAATRAGGVVLTLRDVTARRRLAEEAREGDLILRQVLGACPAAVFMAELDTGQILYRSPAATDLVGPVRTARDLFASREACADFVTALMPNGRVDAMQVECRHVRGTRFPAAISGRVIEHRGQDVMVVSLVDSTDEIAMRAELARQREAIFQAEKMSALGELLAGVAHELNNPLSVVVGHALMLREETTDPETLRRIDRIGDAAERCARIVRSFLAMARQEPAVLAAVDLGAAISTALDGLRQGRSPVKARVELDLARDLPPVLADAGQLAQVVANLVGNADQALAGRPDPVVTVATRRSGDRVELTVADNGPGIPEALLGRVFDPFFTTKEVGEGTGLGLALCHRIVTSHGGTIVASASRGGGALFTVTLPAARDAAEATPKAAAEAAATPAARILVVEDEPDVAALVSEILRRTGYVVEHAVSAEAALERLGRARFDAILSDLAMPGLGGRGLHAAIARDRPELLSRLAFVTGDTIGPSASAFLATTDRPRLEKPIAPAELRALVRRLLKAAP